MQIPYLSVTSLRLKKTYQSEYRNQKELPFAELYSCDE